MSALRSTATFVMPLFCDQPDSFDHAVESVKSIVAQSDPDWRLVIVEDFSPTPAAQRRAALDHLHALDPERIVVIANESNRGAGECRNIGVDAAHRAGSPIVLFHDGDDIAHPRRLEVTRAVFAGGDADFVYSPFAVIDEDGREPGRDEITPSIREILEALDRDPAQGRDCWISLATETGYLTLTSTVAVRTEVARRHPFPNSRGSEDTHTFLRMSAGGAVFSYQPSIPARYRIRRGGGSSDRARIGRQTYYATKVRIDCDGFEQACRLARGRGVLTEDAAAVLRRRFRARLAETIEAEGLGELLVGAW